MKASSPGIELTANYCEAASSADMQDHKAHRLSNPKPSGEERIRESAFDNCSSTSALECQDKVCEVNAGLSDRAGATEKSSMRFNGKLILSIAVFALCIAPTMVSYKSYIFSWDDADYLWRSIAVSKAFWSGNAHEMRSTMVHFRPPMMTLLGLPWGTLRSWDAAGKCFVTLTGLNALFAACCLFLMLRVGLKPLYLVIASACLFAALGPYPAGSDVHVSATAFMADSLFAWTAFAAMLLIPYEATSLASSTTESLIRGILWAVIFSAGAITKVSFFYFIVLVIPILVVVRVRHSGLRSALLSLLSLSVCSLPVVIYWLRYGQPVLRYGRAASFGPTADLYLVPLSQFLNETVRQAPGVLLSGIFAIVGTVYLIVKRRDVAWGTNVLPILVLVGYCTISLASPNREIRFLLPGIIALPFFIGLLISGKTTNVPSHRHAIIAAIFVFCCIVAAGVPMMHRADRQSIYFSEVVLAQAVESNANRVVLATDSSSLNSDLMRLAVEVSPKSPVESYSLAWRAASGVPIEDDFRTIGRSDLVVFQNSEILNSPFTNVRVSKYEQYTRQHFGNVPVKIVDGMRIYEAPIRPKQ
jgi:hypothetical protein